MEIDKDISEKFLNILLVEIIDVTRFSIKDILSNNEQLKMLAKDENSAIKICTAVMLLGKTYEYLELLGNGIFKLTEKGIAAKAKGGHFKYQNSIKKYKMSLFEMISTPVILLTLALAIYQEFNNKELENRFKKLDVKIEIIESNLKEYKDSLQNYKNSNKKVNSTKTPTHYNKTP